METFRKAIGFLFGNRVPPSSSVSLEETRPSDWIPLLGVPLALFLLSGTASLQAQQAPDISSVPADLEIPELTEGEPSAGKRVRLSLFPDAPPVILYLPLDWTPDSSHPVFVELAGNGNYRNAFGDTSTGRPEGSNLGYGLTGGRKWIWVCVPFLNEAGDKTALTWWGDAPERRPDSTVAFLKRVLPALCERFSGDPQRILLGGFSRGAIACNAIGLHDDEIAALWAGFICYSHYDGVREGWPFQGADRISARNRLERLAERPQLICHESSSGRTNLEATHSYLQATGIEGRFTFLETGFRNHNDAWSLRPSPAREEARMWLREFEGKQSLPDR